MKPSQLLFLLAMFGVFGHPTSTHADTHVKTVKVGASGFILYSSDQGIRLIDRDDPQSTYLICLYDTDSKLLRNLLCDPAHQYPFYRARDIVSFPPTHGSYIVTIRNDLTVHMAMACTADLVYKTFACQKNVYGLLKE
jgi:hypothetical protein